MDPDGLSELCAEIRALLQAELAAGNAIAWVDRSFSDHRAHMVMLVEPFRVAHAPDPRIKRTEVNDPHWWGADLTCTLHAHQLACPVSFP